MRSALLCVFFALIVHREGRATTNEDFKPTPIPLNEWRGETKDELAGTLQEVVATDTPPSVAAIPAHYWEDALRHSVYLTLVRDKIDQLIAKGSVITSDNKLEHASKEIDDHNLWEKIKSAPFDRLSVEEPATMGDITIMSKGRLLEEKNGYRFTEDKSSKEKCNDEKCMEGVKAFWSVKRVRQRDAETIPGKYHYELTFSVNSQAPKKNKKPYDNPVRTFTVREGSPIQQPQYTQPPNLAPRPQRAIWVHKNIVPNQHYQSRKTYQPQGLDRFFLSLFSDEEDEPPRKPSPYVPQGYHGPQHSKAGYAGAPSEQHQHKKPAQYHYKPTTYKYSRPPLGPPPSAAQAEHHYIDSDKLKLQFSPPKVQFRYPDSDGKPRNPQLPAQGPPQYIDPSKTNNPYPPIQTQQIDSDKTPNSVTQIQPQYNIDSNQEVPFSQQVQHFLDEVKAKHPYPTNTQTKYHYELKSKVQPPINQQHHYREPDVKTNIQYPPQPDYRYQPSNVVKTTRPAILPTPSSEPQNITMGVTDKLNVSEITTKDPEIVTAFKPYVKPPMHKPPPTKMSYFPEHIRPPVFNAPPGVFVTMDKKPFKPMPPLKYHHNHHLHVHSKPIKSRPSGLPDFRPSPQVVDVQLFSDPDPLSDAFRPMNVHYSDNTTSSSESSENDGSSKHKNSHHKNLHKTKPPKKHELVKSQRTTTSTPEIITAQSQSIEESDSMHWANNLLSAFVKTTPMVSQETNNATINETETTTSYEPTTTDTETTSTAASTTTEMNKEVLTTTTTSTTPKQKKRTRPPPKFTKQEKLKKHKRITTTTTTSTTTTTTTTEKPRSKRPTQDLTPQASSAATGTKSGWQPKSKIQNETTVTPDNLITTTAKPTTTYRSTTKFTTTKPTTTTTKPTTTTTKPTTTTPTPETEIPVVTTQPKSTNRFRISTLKGTSVNHDKWIVPTIDSNNINKTRQFGSKHQQRRKGSNFQGYVSSTPKNIEEDHHKEHVDVAYNANTNDISSTTEMLLEVIPVTPAPTPDKSSEDESDYPSGTEDPDAEDSDESEEESKDHSEYIFSTKTEATVNSNEVDENEDVKKETVETTPHTIVKNKTKCKKKKHMNLTTTENPDLYSDSVEVIELITTTEQPTTEADIFAQIFSSYTVAGLPHDNQTKEPVSDGSENQERFAHIDDDLEDFLDSLEGKQNDKYDNEKSYEQYDEESEESDYSPFNNEEESRSPRHANINYEEYRDRPYSFLELLAME